MTQPMTADTGVPSGIEAHSIDYIPKRERHGKPRDQFTLWFLGNAELATLAVGLIGISLGLSLFWCLVATALGVFLGTLFMAFHSVQGPRLGIPQLLQSRPQFGYYGALIPQLIGVFLYVGFNVFNTIIAGQALSTVTGGALSLQVGIVVMAVVAFAVTVGGYDWIHFAQRWGTYIFLVVFGIFTIGVIATSHLPAAQQGVGDFQLTPFLVVFAVVASYQVSQAPYVSDYSRYLGEGATLRNTFAWTYAGSALGSFWMIGLGALLLAANPSAQTVDAVAAGGNAIFNGFGTIALAISLIGLVTVISLNLYSGSLAALAAIDVATPIRASVSTRTIAIVVIALLGTGGALGLPADFLGSYNTFLVVLLYFLTPWTAINLVDFFFVRKGNYAIKDIFSPSGIYGRWNWRGLVSYFVGFAVMSPFFIIGAPINFTGVAAQQLGGDFSVFVGLVVSAVLYYVLAKGYDLGEEQKRASMSEAELEASGVPEPGAATA